MMKEWFNNLRRQEQLMVLFGAFALALYIVFMWILAPMSDKIATLERQNHAAAVSLAEVKELAKVYKQLNQSGRAASVSDGNLTRIVDSTVKNNQLKMTRFQPSSSGDVQVRFENAAFNNIAAWINELESGNGVLVRDLSLTPGSAKGLVNVSVRLSLSG